MPAEWELHAATWLAWPHYHGDWPGKFEPIPWVYAEIIRNLAKRERVELIVNSAAAARQAWIDRLGPDVPVILTSSVTRAGLAELSRELMRRIPASDGEGGRGARQGCGETSYPAKK